MKLALDVHGISGDVTIIETCAVISPLKAPPVQHLLTLRWWDHRAGLSSANLKCHYHNHLTIPLCCAKEFQFLNSNHVNKMTEVHDQIKQFKYYSNSHWQKAGYWEISELFLSSHHGVPELLQLMVSHHAPAVNSSCHWFKAVSVCRDTALSYYNYVSFYNFPENNPHYLFWNTCCGH